MTERLARTCARHPWRTVTAWLAVLLLSLAAAAFLLPDVLTGAGEVTVETESKRANELMFTRIDAGPVYGDVLVVRSNVLVVEDPAFRAKVDELLAAVDRATPYVETQTDEPIVSEDRHARVIPISFVGPGAIDAVVDVVEEADGAGWHVGVTGSDTLDEDFGALSQEDLKNGELYFGAPAALLILLLVFGSVVAGLVPIVLAGLAIVVALALTSLVGQAFELSDFVVNMITGMGLALGIDYSLFVVSRYREERTRGREKLEAIAAAGATASRAVLISGLAFALAMIGMVLVPDTVLRSLAVGAILVGVVSVLAALTLLPAVLSLLGDRVNALRIPFVGRSVASSAGAEGRFWTAIVRRVVRAPVVSLVLSAGLLIALAVPVLDLERGNSGVTTLPERFPSRHGLVLLQESFPDLGTEPARIVVAGDVRAPAVAAAIGRLTDALADRPPFGEPTVEESDAGDLAVVSVAVGADADSQEAVDAIRNLRGEIVPEAFAGVDAEVLVGGEAAEGVDYFDLIAFWLPIVFLFVLGLSVILLTIAFRSLAISAIAIVLNLLSVGAAYGLMVLVFQKGYGADFFGFQQVDAIDAWVPLFLFSVLFGLSMDYQVFLLSRIKERFDQSGDTKSAVVYGVGSTARLITGAALIIVAVFVGFAAGDLASFQQMGFGVAVSLLIDATIVRSVLMPAALSLLGDRAWYLPRWLAWLPRLEVEGGKAR